MICHTDSPIRRAGLVLTLSLMAIPRAWAQANVEEEIKARFENAHKAEQRGEIIRAESEYRYVLGLSLLRLGGIYSRLADYPASERAFRECVQAIANSEEGLTGLGVNYLRAGEYEKGIEVAQKLLDLSPFNANARRLLGKIYLMQKKYQEASVELSEANRSREDFSTSYALALAYMSMSRLDEVRRIFDRMATLAENKPPVYLLLGRAYREIHQVDLALGEFRKALAVDPKYPRVHYYMGLTYLSAEANPDIEMALQEFKLETTIQPDEFAPQFFTGMVYARQRNTDEAVRYLTKATQLDPTNFKARYYLGLTLAVAQRCEESIPQLEKAVEVADATTDARSKAAVYYQLGQCLRRVGKIEEAQKQLKVAQDIRLGLARNERANLEGFLQSPMEAGGDRELDKPGETGLALIEESLGTKERENLELNKPVFARMAASAYNGIALLYASKSDFPKAADYLGLAAGWDDSIPDLYYNLGLAYFRQQKNKDALAPLSKAIEKDPKNMTARRLLGIVSFTAGDYSRAAEQFSSIVGNAPEKDPQTTYSLCLALVQVNRTKEAEPLVDKLISAAPKMAELYALKGQIYAQREEYIQAVEVFDHALSIKPNLADVNFFAGMAFLRQSKFDDALKRFEQELKRDPNHIQAKFHVAYIAVLKNEKEQALSLLQEVIRMNPYHPQALYELGKLQLERGDLPPAVANLEMAADLDPQKFYIFYQLYRAYLKVGRDDDAKQALEHYQKLKERAPSQP